MDPEVKDGPIPMDYARSRKRCSTLLAIAVALAATASLVYAYYWWVEQVAPSLAFGPGMGDFDAPLGHGYAIWRTSAHQIQVSPEGWGSETPIIPPKVVELGHNGTWVIAKQQHLRRRSLSPTDTYEEPDPGVFSWWILRLDKPQVWGPLSQPEFGAKREELGVPANIKLRDVNGYRP
jgi:hypothetical protein